MLHVLPLATALPLVCSRPLLACSESCRRLPPLPPPPLQTEVQRTMLSVLRRVAVASPAALPPVWKDIVPSICAIVQVI